ncbi:MAG: SusD/RagB family nutrient-binding outer membrane lipoprotein [Flavobacteriaceae bacterium]|nr:SusD/RagB family nutrient-binding outer membrane lipoprotein [Flavobacteriaceae bacterium]
MKKINKYIIVALLTVAGLFQACETTDLDIKTSPNELDPTSGDPNLQLNAIQLAYVTSMNNLSDLGGELTRIQYMSGRIYFNNYGGGTLSGTWERTYSSGSSFGQNLGIWTNVDGLIALDATSDVDYSFHVAVGQTLKAHMLMLLVDYIGEAVYSEAGNPDEFPAPLMDDGASVYAEALALLDEAEAMFNAGPSTQGATDFFYDGDTTKWAKLVNTLRLKAYITTGNTAAFDAVIAEGDANFISSTEDDFQFQYGTRSLQPDTRHPDYGTDYTVSGAGAYRSNWLMQYMLNVDDPRIRYYFYRQSGATPGADADPDEETLACSLAIPPVHYQESEWAYCAVPEGYWGRSHGNNEGTPPDGFQRTAVGVYPAAGKFDDDDFAVPEDDDNYDPVVNLGAGGGGAGIEPIILASYVDFWRADNAMAKGSSDAIIEGFFRDGLQKSIEKVQAFGSLDPSADLSFAPTETEITDWIDGIIADFSAASGDEKMDIFADQYFVTMYGGSSEAYNFYRKTGYPTNLAPNWEPDPGAFPRTFLYPQSEVITNPNLTQKTDMAQQVFWDTNPASPAFPPAN